jgi:hypothetical protein
MSIYSKTGIVMNDPNKVLGLPPYYYRCRNCDIGMTSNTPANRYQTQKIIQNTVRVPSSLYTMNLGAFNVYSAPVKYGVSWNQMSDRPIPSVQRATAPTGINNSLNTRKSSVTSSRPGCQTPGGIGCDIKHNSYDRYLNRLKGKKPLRNGVITKEFQSPYIPFNVAFPIRGSKTIKTGIISGCNCPPGNKDMIYAYDNPLYQPEPEPKYGFYVGQLVYAIEGENTYYSKAEVIEIINDSTYVVRFEDETIETKNIGELMIYYPCQCGELPPQVKGNGNLGIAIAANQFICFYPGFSDLKRVL